MSEMGTVDNCLVCGRGPFRLTHLYDHLRRVHSWKESQIDEQRAKYKQRRYGEMDELRCDLCHKVYHSHRSWKRHREFAHITDRTMEGPYVVCSECQQKFPNSSALAKHWIDEHSGQDNPPSTSCAGLPPMMISPLNSSKRKIECSDRKPENKALEVNLIGSDEASGAFVEDEHDEEEVVMIEKRETRASKKQQEEVEAVKIVGTIKEAESARSGRSTELEERGMQKSGQSEERCRPGLPRETPEQRSARLQRIAERRKIRRLDGNPQQRLMQLKLDSERKKFRRSIETEEERAQRLYKAREKRWEIQHQRPGQEYLAEGVNDVRNSRKECRLIPHPASPQHYSALEGEAIRDLVALKESVSTINQRRSAICYAVVGIRSIALRTLFRNLMERFNFNDLVFVNNPIFNDQVFWDPHTNGGSVEPFVSTASTAPSKNIGQEKSSGRCEADDDVVVLEEKSSVCNHCASSKPSTSQQSAMECTSDGEKLQKPSTGAAKENNELLNAAQPDKIPSRKDDVQPQRVPVAVRPIQTTAPQFQLIQLHGVPPASGVVQAFQCRSDSTHACPSGLVQNQRTSIGEDVQEPANGCEKTLSGTSANSNAYLGSTKNDNSTRNYCCLICDGSRSAHEVRHSSFKRQQNIVFLACLQAQNIIDMDFAKQVYKELQHSRKRICHDHYVQAATFIGKEVEEMWGKFPEHGIDEVPRNTREDLLAYVQVYGEYLDESVTLNCDDIARFFYECLMKYYKKKGWSVQEIGKESKKKKETRNESTHVEDLVKFVEPSSSNESSLDGAANTIVKSEMDVQDILVISESYLDENGSPLFNEATDEPVNSEEISAMDLMEPEPTPQPPPALDSLVLIGTASVDSEGALSVQLDDPEQHDNSVVGFSPNPTRILRDSSSCLDTLDDEQFRKRFRMTRKTFGALCKTLGPLLKSKRQRTGTCSTGIKVGMALEILAGNNFTFAGGSVMQTSASQILADVLETLLEWSATMIQWPDEKDSKRISDNFFEMTGLSDIVGCIDGTIINGFQNLNVGLVADDQKRFRWVFAKFHSDTDDDSVFKRSLLCKQLREGVKKGRLIGDNAYKSELFLLAPDEIDETSAKNQALATMLRKTHTLVQEAIADWKRQFPILKADIRSSRAARIIVSCAALYNLTRLEGEPSFSIEEDSLFKVEQADLETLVVK